MKLSVRFSGPILCSWLANGGEPGVPKKGNKVMNAIAKKSDVATVADVKADTKTAKPVAVAATVPQPKAEFNGIVDRKKEITAAQIWQFVREKAGNNPANVEVVLLDGVDPKSASPFPFTQMAKSGKRAEIMWALVNGAGKEKSRKLSDIRQYAITKGMSGQWMDDIVAALNGGYSSKAKTFGTAFIKLVVR